MSRPNDEKKLFWFEQALEYNEVKRKLTIQYNAHFVYVWNLVPREYIVDSSHMTIEGHEILYEEVSRILNSNQ